MGERNFYMRYKATRGYADEQASQQSIGCEVSGWAYEDDFKPGMPEPPKITMAGNAWIAHCYTIAAEDAELLASRDTTWQRRVNECRALAAKFQEEARKDEFIGCRECGELNCSCMEWMLT